MPTIDELQQDARFAGIDLNARIDALYAAVNERFPETDQEGFRTAWLKAPYDDKVIVQVGEKLMSVPYTVDENEAITLGEATEVVKKPDEYVPVTMTAEEEEALAAKAAVFLKSFKELTAVGFSSLDAHVRALGEAGVKFDVQREAKLFEAGVYADKDMEVTEAELDDIVRAHEAAAPIPIKVEHTDTVFDGALGAITKVWRKGKELFGMLSFTDDAWGLIKNLELKGLSVGIKHDKSSLAEVSLVRDPRIADAQVFAADCVGFNTALDWPEPETTEIPKTPKEVEHMSETTDKTPELTAAEAIAVITQFKAGSAEAEMLKQAAKDMAAFSEAGRKELSEVAEQINATTAELQKNICDNLVAGFKREGKITPATEPMWRALLAHKPLSTASVKPQDTVAFKRSADADQESAHWADVLVEILNASPPVVNFRELGKIGDETTALSPESVAMFKAFGVDPNSETAKMVIAEMRR
jgi:hypothetical protein